MEARGLRLCAHAALSPAHGAARVVVEPLLDAAVVKDVETRAGKLPEGNERWLH